MFDLDQGFAQGFTQEQVDGEFSQICLHFILRSHETFTHLLDPKITNSDWFIDLIVISYAIKMPKIESNCIHSPVVLNSMFKCFTFLFRYFLYYFRELISIFLFKEYSFIFALKNFISTYMFFCFHSSYEIYLNCCKFIHQLQLYLCVDMPLVILSPFLEIICHT